MDTVEIKAFVPARDLELKRFYADLGFIDGGIHEIHGDVAVVLRGEAFSASVCWPAVRSSGDPAFIAS